MQYQVVKNVLRTGLIMTLAIIVSGQSAGAQFWRRTSLRGSGDIISEVRDLKGFSRIEAGSASNVYISFGDQWHVEIEADDNVMEYIETGVRRETLFIGMDNSVRSIGRMTFNVYVTLPELKVLTASGAADIIFEDPVSQQSITLKASGASNIKVTVEVDALEIVTSGASDIDIEGFAHYAEVTASGASDIKGARFECIVADVKLSGASDMCAVITEKVTGSLSGASDLRIIGNPEVRVSSSGASSVIAEK